jgi:hypothetical protein
MTAKTAVLPGEDQGAFDAKVDAWIEAFEPSDDVEKSLIAAAAKAFWRHERVQRIHAKKLASRIRNYPEEYAHKLEGDANALGKRLMDASVRGGDAHDPRDLVHKLEGMLHGCQWLLDGWEDLGVALEEDQGWNPSFKLQALHLLGMRLSSSNYERYMVARSSSDPQLKVWLNQVLNAHLPIPIPDDDAGARLAFLSIIKTSESRLKTLLKRHKKRYDADYAARCDLAAFDSSDEGERFRKYEFSAGRTFSRALRDAIYYRRNGELPQPSRRGSRGNTPKQDNGDRRPVEPGVVHNSQFRSSFLPECEPIIAMTAVDPCEVPAPWQAGEYYVFGVDTAEITALLYPLVGEEVEPICTFTTDDPMPVASGTEGKSITASESPADPRPAPQRTIATRAATPSGAPVLGLLGLILSIALMALGATHSAERHAAPVRVLPKAQSPHRGEVQREVVTANVPIPEAARSCPSAPRGEGQRDGVRATIPNPEATPSSPSPHPGEGQGEGVLATVPDPEAAQPSPSPHRREGQGEGVCAEHRSGTSGQTGLGAAMAGLERSLGSGGAPHPPFGHLLPGGEKGTAGALADCAQRPLSETAHLNGMHSYSSCASRSSCSGQSVRPPRNLDARTGKTNPILVLAREPPGCAADLCPRAAFRSIACAPARSAFARKRGSARGQPIGPVPFLTVSLF